MDEAMAGRPVVAGIDDTPYGLDIADLAAWYARLRGRPLLLLRAIEWPDLDLPLGPQMSGPIAHDLQAQAEADVEAAEVRARHISATLDIRTQVVVCGPAAALVQASTEASAVVVGAHGRGGIAGLLAGSVAVQVATHAHSPVLVVRGHTTPGGDVVLGVDGSAHSAAATAFAFEEAALRGAGLTAVYAWRHPMSNGHLQPSTVEQRQADADRLLTATLADLVLKYPDVPVRHLVVHGGAARALTDASAHARLVVVGARGHGGFAGLMLGSVGQALLHRAACPVAVVHTLAEAAGDGDLGAAPAS